MNPIKVLKESLPALTQVVGRVLEELEEINASNKQILAEITKQNDSKIDKDKAGSPEYR